MLGLAVQRLGSAARPTFAPRFVGHRSRLRATRVLSSKEERKKTVEELAALQGFGTEEGAEASGRQDPGPKHAGAASQGRRELDIDAGLKSALRPLLAGTRARMAEHQGGPISPEAVASAAVAAAEASGALPPLAGPQRTAVQGFFARLAEEFEQDEGGLEAGGFEAFGSSGGEAGFGEDDAALRVRPHTREVLEAVINWHLSDRGSTRISKGPSDSVKTGGEVGNIALQSDTHHSAKVKGVPAESESDRAERQAEAQFEALELGDLPQANPDELREQLEWERSHPVNQRWANASIEGDAPAAGDGLQVVDSPQDAHLPSGGQNLSTAADQIKQASTGSDRPGQK